jgi:hypothetical protein
MQVDAVFIVQTFSTCILSRRSKHTAGSGILTEDLGWMAEMGPQGLEKQILAASAANGPKESDLHRDMSVLNSKWCPAKLPTWSSVLHACTYMSVPVLVLRERLLR